MRYHCLSLFFLRDTNRLRRRFANGGQHSGTFVSMAIAFKGTARRSHDTQGWDGGVGSVQGRHHCLRLKRVQYSERVLFQRTVVQRGRIAYVVRTYPKGNV